MNHPMPKASLAERRSATRASTDQSATNRKRGPITQLTGPNAFKTDGNHHPGNVLPGPISAVASFIQPTPSTDKAAAETKKPRKKRTKPQGPEYQPIPLDKLKWLTIAQAAIRFPSFTEKSIRHYVAHAEMHAKYPMANLRSNGFLPCIVRPAGQRKIIIDAGAFETWLSSSQMGAKS